MMFMFCIACPDAPFTRLSIAAITTSCPTSSTLIAPIWQLFDPRTLASSGSLLSLSTCVNGSSL